jgi:hypothetical protein
MYSTFVASSDFWREEGIGMANGIVIDDVKMGEGIEN